MTDLFDQLNTFYLTHAEIIFPILVMIFIAGVALAIAMAAKDTLIRIAIIGVTSCIFLLLSFFPVIKGDFISEYFLNIGTVLLGALAAMWLRDLAEFANDWRVPLYTAAGLALLTMTFINPAQTTTSLPGNLSVMALGGWVTAFLLRKEWGWSPAKRDEKLVTAMRGTHKHIRKATGLTAEDAPDFTILIRGDDEAAIEQKQQFLAASDMKIVKADETQLDQDTGAYYRLLRATINTAVKEPDTVLLNADEARLRIMGYPDTVKQVYAQITEVLDDYDRTRLEGPGEMSHVEFKVHTPQTRFSAYIENSIFELARTWRYGDDEHLQAATTALLDWAQQMKFIEQDSSDLMK